MGIPLVASVHIIPCPSCHQQARSKAFCKRRAAARWDEKESSDGNHSGSHRPAHRGPSSRPPRETADLRLNIQKRRPARPQRLDRRAQLDVHHQPSQPSSSNVNRAGIVPRGQVPVKPDEPEIIFAGIVPRGLHVFTHKPKPINWRCPAFRRLVEARNPPEPGDSENYRFIRPPPLDPHTYNLRTGQTIDHAQDDPGFLEDKSSPVSPAIFGPALPEPPAEAPCGLLPLFGPLLPVTAGKEPSRRFENPIHNLASAKGLPVPAQPTPLLPYDQRPPPKLVRRPISQREKEERRFRQRERQLLRTADRAVVLRQAREREQSKQRTGRKPEDIRRRDKSDKERPEGTTRTPSPVTGVQDISSLGSPILPVRSSTPTTDQESIVRRHRSSTPLSEQETEELSILAEQSTEEYLALSAI